MNAANTVPAVLLYYDRAGVFQRAETNASPFDCDSAFRAGGDLAALRPALVLADDEQAALAELARRKTVEAMS